MFFITTPPAMPPQEPVECCICFEKQAIRSKEIEVPDPEEKKNEPFFGPFYPPQKVKTVPSPINNRRGSQKK